ncbi:hypothetical protein K402DRAFT_73885 [Aulographum hederae CBS 113979]|uniref:Uncharacterized protein n=1 Tax=Aulographum hederae CBS 113979 TaxID=1176131 RepID=A0A6G1HFG6_9PEZI|nr:hypothetical protein K402DRAFT_73885 [Aulographum hederae CBS 113979]
MCAVCTLTQTTSQLGQALGLHQLARNEVWPTLFSDIGCQKSCLRTNEILDDLACIGQLFSRAAEALRALVSSIYTRLLPENHAARRRRCHVDHVTRSPVSLLRVSIESTVHPIPLSNAPLTRSGPASAASCRVQVFAVSRRTNQRCQSVGILHHPQTSEKAASASIVTFPSVETMFCPLPPPWGQ